MLLLDHSSGAVWSVCSSSSMAEAVSNHGEGGQSDSARDYHHGDRKVVMVICVEWFDLAQDQATFGLLNPPEHLWLPLDP